MRRKSPFHLSCAKTDSEMRDKYSGFSRLLSHGSFMFGLCITGSIVLLGICAPVFTRVDPQNIQVSNRFALPSFEHPFGTDHLGRDIWSRVVFGARISLKVSSFSVAAASVLGVFIGTFASYTGGWVDNLTMRVVDALLAFPTIIFALLLRLVLGPGTNSIIITLAFVYMLIFVRTVRGSVLLEKEKTYVLAASAIGRGALGIALRHILPNILPPIIVLATTLLADAIIVESSLSFIGVGASIFDPSWGTMLKDSVRFMQEYPHVAIFPGLVISLAVLGINLLGNSLQDVLNPRHGRNL